MCLSHFLSVSLSSIAATPPALVCSIVEYKSRQKRDEWAQTTNDGRSEDGKGVRQCDNETMRQWDKNHLHMMDVWPASHQTLCVHGFHGQRNPTWRQTTRQIVDCYYVWKACDDTRRSLTCSCQLHITYVEPVPTGQKYVAGSSYPCARAGHCWPLGLGQLGRLPAKHGHDWRDMDKQDCA